jgi:hypothetical protein
MAATKWFLSMRTAEGITGITLTQAGPGGSIVNSGAKVTTEWSVDAPASIIAECLHDLADELRDATASD